ncbi:hypothetical protein LUU34_01018500 [Aix galericulata]|nr:hypothetical protein LUU34_01018500 [Aix galericulata]
MDSEVLKFTPPPQMPQNKGETTRAPMSPTRCLSGREPRALAEEPAPRLPFDRSPCPVGQPPAMPALEHPCEASPCLSPPCRIGNSAALR